MYAALETHGSKHTIKIRNIFSSAMAWPTTYNNIIERHGLIDCFSIRFDYVVQVSCQRIPCVYDRLRASVSSIARQGMKMKLGPFQLVEVSNITNQAIYTTLRVLTASATLAHNGCIHNSS